MLGRHVPSPAELEPLVRDALGHLYDPERLETHPLTRFLPEESFHGTTGRGQALRRALIGAIEALRSPDVRMARRRGERGYDLLSLRYVEALEIADVRGRLAVSRSQYHADHRRAVAAVASLLWHRWRCDHPADTLVVPTAPPSLAGPPASTDEETGFGPTNLPAELTSFVGRRRELAGLKRLLGASRLVTLTGAGGCGKTRLARRVGAGLRAAYPNGVWLVDLAPLAAPSESPDRVAAAVAAALGLVRPRRQPPLDGLVRTLGRRRLLLILDNCEHLVAACARLSDAVLGGCPGVRMLATSREPLRAAGEVVWPVPPLSVPPTDEPVSVADVVASEAGRLFAERAAAARPGFAVTAPTAPAVARICRRLDGIPLAIELAAAWVRSLGPEQIAARVGDGLDLPAGGSRTAPPRQRTLRATLEWSHALLTGPEQVLLRRLGVFAGGWTLEAGEAVCHGEDVGVRDVLGLLAGLVDRSLVVAEAHGGAVRYRFLETIRQYAAEKLADAGEESAFQAGHRDWCLALSEAARPELTGPHHAVWAGRLAAEHDNLRAALAWCHQRGDGAEGLRLAANLGWYWIGEGHLNDGCRWLDLFVALAPQPTALRARALVTASLLERFNGDAARSARLGKEAAAIARAIGDDAVENAAEVEIGLAEASSGDYARARARLGACLGRARAQNDDLAVRDRACDLGLVCLASGDLPAARALFAESLALARRSGNRGMVGLALVRMAVLDRLEGNLASARAAIDQACALAREARAAMERFQSALGNQARAEGHFAEAEAILTDVLVRSHAAGDQVVAAEQLCWLGVLRIAQGRFAEGVALIGVGAPVGPLPGTIHTPDLRLEVEASLARARAMLGEDGFAVAWVAGQATTPDACLVGGTLRPPTVGPDGEPGAQAGPASDAAYAPSALGGVRRRWRSER